MPRPLGIIPIDTNNEKYARLCAKFHGIAPQAIDLFNQINNRTMDEYTSLKRATGNWYINYYYLKYGKNYVAFKIDTKQDGCNTQCLNITLYYKDVENHFSRQEIDYYHISEKPEGYHKHGKFPYQASFSDISEITKAYELLEKIYSITKSQLEKY